MATENHFADFVADLVRDPEKIKRYQSDPGQVMDEAGLSAEEQEVMSSNDVDVVLDYARATAPRPGGGGTQGQTGGGSSPSGGSSSPSGGGG